MFIDLQTGEGDAIVIAVNSIDGFGGVSATARNFAYTRLKMRDGGVIEVRETPEEIKALIVAAIVAVSVAVAKGVRS
jgi:hypothetical protein